MSFFRKDRIKTSDDYYEAYKSEIGIKEEKRKNTLLNNILKIEVAVIATALFIMNHNHISIEFKRDHLALNNSLHLPTSIQTVSDQDLVVHLTEKSTPIANLKIQEDNFEEVLDSEIAENEVYKENEEMKLLIKSLQTELKAKNETDSSNRLIISQR